jgi:predicted nuclease with RNAse H fold
MMGSKTEKLVFVGIDVAMAKRKRLPICVCELVDNVLQPLPLRSGFEKPPHGMGNKSALDAHARNDFASKVSKWLQKLQKDRNLNISCIAIDAPSTYCDQNRDRRVCEKELDKKGISCFATPNKTQFEQKIQNAKKHLDDGKTEATMPNANQFWMLVGFALFEQLAKDGFCCIETYPQAIVHELNCSQNHKSTKDGYASQLKEAAKATSFKKPEELQGALDKMGFGSKDDKLDAFLTAWVASIPTKMRKVYGRRPTDSIIVPDMSKIKSSGKPTGAIK